MPYFEYIMGIKLSLKYSKYSFVTESKQWTTITTITTTAAASFLKLLKFLVECGRDWLLAPKCGINNQISMFVAT